MKIRVAKVAQLKNHNVYIRNFGNIFEYLLVMGREVYAAHIVVKKRWWWFGEYPKKVEAGAVKILLNMADATLEIVSATKTAKNGNQNKTNQETKP
jgi:hypothetical protein